MSITFEERDCPPHLWVREGVGLRTCLQCTVTEEYEEMECYCEDKDTYALTVTEGNVDLICTECGKPLVLDAIGWWDEALHMDDPVLVTLDFVTEHTMDGVQPSYIEMTQVAGS